MLYCFALPVLTLLTFLPHINAQQGAWAQCGGQDWSGGTACVTGYACTYSNAWYSQCLPGSATSSSTVPTSVSTGPPASPTKGPSVNYWFSFGDSYTQTGFVDNEILPAPGNPLGNPPYPGYTAVGGVNWIDVDTTVYNKSLVLTYNYAYGGATIDASLVQPYEPTVLSLTDQVNEFLSTVANKPASTPWTSSNSLFSIWIGINDIGNSYSNAGNRTAFSTTLLNAEFALAQELYNVGARNFLWNNVPPIDSSPLMLAEAASAQAVEKAVIIDFNNQLASQIEAFKANNSGVSTWLFDANTAFSTVLESPSTYGFVDNTSYGNAGDFWGNNYHPSSDAQTIFGQQIGDLLADTVW